MNASAMFSDIKDLARFLAAPQAVQYMTGDAYEQLSSYWIDFTIECFINTEDMKERVRKFNGVLVVHVD